MTWIEATMPTSRANAPPTDRTLARLRLDSRLEPVRSNRAALATPRGGWLRAMRRALGMSLADMADRLGSVPSSVSRLELSEQKGTIQLDSLRRAAEALNCELAYVLIPREPLEPFVDKRRRLVAKQLNATVRTHMALEGQDTRDTRLDQWREDRAVALVSDRQLWKKRK
jgi:predicted DNA-binding mobile mystery protein A